GATRPSSRAGRHRPSRPLRTRRGCPPRPSTTAPTSKESAVYDYNDVPPYETHIGETVILDYINAVEAFAHGMGQGGEPYLAQAEDRARWMVEKSSGMGSIPDLRILHAAIKSVLPSGHPRHAATMSAEELRVCYKYRPLIGEVHEHASKT